MKNKQVSIERKKLICFIGIDGTGKTTLAQATANLLQERGIKAIYTRGYFESFTLLRPLIFLVKFFLSLLRRKMDNSPEGMKTKRKLFKNRFLGKLWDFSVSLDYLVQLIVKVRLPLMRGKIVVCDRYIYDTVVDLAVDLGYSSEEMLRKVENLLSLAPKPSLTFLLDLPPEKAFDRNLLKKDGISVDYLAQRKALYSCFSHQPKIILLDSSQSLDSLKETLGGYLS